MQGPAEPFRYSPVGIINHVETSWIPGVIYRYSPFLQITHSCGIRLSQHVHDFSLNSRWYRDRYQSNVIYASGDCVSLRTNQ